FLYGAVLVALAVDQPRDFGIGSLGADLLGPDTSGTDEIRPPMIVWLDFVFLPHHQGGTTDKEHVFAANRRGGRGLAGKKAQQNQKQKQSFHRKWLGAVFMLRTDSLQVAVAFYSCS